MSIMLNTRFSYTAEDAHPKGKQTTVVCSAHFYGMQDILWNNLWNVDILWNFCETVFQGFFKCH